MKFASLTAKVAFRYLKALRSKHRIRYIRLVPLFFLLATLIIFALDSLLLSKTMISDQSVAHRAFILGKYIGVLSTSLVLIFVELMIQFTIFTTISTFGMFLGTGALVTIISFMSAIQADLKQKMLGTHAHMMIEGQGRPYISDYNELIDKVKQVNGVLAATPHLATEMIIVNEHFRSLTGGVVVRGVVPSTFVQVTNIEKSMVSGSIDNLIHPENIFLPNGKGPSLPSEQKTPARLPGIILGKELAQHLSMRGKKTLPLGSEVLLLSPFGDGPTGNIPSIRRFQLAGIFYTGMYDYDARYAYILLPKLQKALGIGDEVNGVEVKLQNEELSEQWISPVQSAISPPTQGLGYRVEDWKMRNQSLFASIKLEKIVMFLGLCLIILVAASSIISNGLMLVAKKQKEIAILKSMGATDRDVLQIFTALGLTVGVLGVTLGIMAGIAACYLLSRFGLPISDDVYYITRVNISVNPLEVLIIGSAAMAIVILATLYPARSAAKARPLDGLR